MSGCWMIWSELNAGDRIAVFKAIGAKLGADTPSELIDILIILGQKGVLFAQASSKSIRIRLAVACIDAEVLRDRELLHDIECQGSCA